MMDNLTGLKLVEKLIKDSETAVVHGQIESSMNVLTTVNKYGVSTMFLPVGAAKYAHKLIKQKEEEENVA